VSTAQLLRHLGYNHAQVLREEQEEGRLVVLFTIPHSGKRRAMTAWVKQGEGWPHVEVMPGFANDQGAIHD